MGSIWNWKKIRYIPDHGKYHARLDQISVMTFRFYTRLPDVTMSAFLKATATKMDAYPEATGAFGVLSCAPTRQELKATMSTIERYVCYAKML